MRLEFLQSHAWQVSLGRFVVLLATALIVGLLLNEPLSSTDHDYLTCRSVDARPGFELFN